MREVPARIFAILARDIFMAGANPNRSGPSRASAIVKTNTRQSIARLPMMGRSAGQRRLTRGRHSLARMRPSKPPARESSTLSPNNESTRRNLPGTRAARTAIAWEPAAARTRMRMATLVQAMRNTNMTATNKIASPWRSLFTR